MSQIIEPSLGQSLPSFDQIVKGNVNIKKLSKYKYRITFSKIGKFLVYQVWDKDDVKMNAKRQVGYVSAKEWVKLFKTLNNSLDKPLFTPTTIMETENRVYAFVIHTVSLNSYDKVVFTVSTKEISLQNNTSKKLVQLPLGKCNHVRFDIDDVNDETWKECICSGCSCTPDKARSGLMPPIGAYDNFITKYINAKLIQQIYNNKKGKDMSDDEMKNYISDIVTYTRGTLFCDKIMGADCKDTTDIFNKWMNAMMANKIKCPESYLEDGLLTTGRFSSKCSSGCIQVTIYGKEYDCVTTNL